MKYILIILLVWLLMFVWQVPWPMSWWQRISSVVILVCIAEIYKK